MSIEAISWVLKQEVARSSEKFVLLCLANYADDRGYCYPSVARLEEDTSQDRKTILASLKRLVEYGLLRDTTRRVGTTRQVVVYQLVGLPDSCKSHYVYTLTHPVTGEFYIGKRSFNGHPELDQYRGSGKWPVAMRQEGVLLLREVVQSFPTSEEAVAAEKAMIRASDGNPLCRNLDTPSVHRMLSLSNSTNFGPVNNPVDEIEEQYRFSGETVPLFPENSTEIGTRNHQGTVIEKKQGEGPVEKTPYEAFWSAVPEIKKSEGRPKGARRTAFTEIRLDHLSDSDLMLRAVRAGIGGQGLSRKELIDKVRQHEARK